MGNADPYLWLENIESKRVARWTLSRSRRCRASLRPLSRIIEPEFAQLYDTPVILQVSVTSRGVLYLEREKGAYRIRLDRKTVVTSRDLGPNHAIHYFHADDDGRRLAYFFSKGEDEGTMRLIQVDSGEKIAELQGTITDVVFAKDSFYYVKNFRKESTPDGVKPPASRVMRDGQVVFGKGVPSTYSIYLKSSHGKALLTVHQWSRTEVHFGDLDSPGTWKKAYGGEFLSYPLEYSRGGLYVLSYEGKGFGRVLRDGTSVITETKYPIHDASIVSDEIVVNYVKDCASFLRVFGGDGKERLSFVPPFKSHVGLTSSDDRRAILEAASFGVPYAVYEYSSGSFREIDKLTVEDLDVADGFVTSKDGTRVHYFAFGGRGRGVMAYGYGGFSIPRTPFYDPVLVQLARMGVTCVVANLRGGNEYGEEWHEAGRREKKQNTFDDFIAVIEKLRGRETKWSRSAGATAVFSSERQ